jgi:hypothetical protein
MKIKLDENLPESLVASLAALDHDVDNVRLESLAGHPDPDIWRGAQNSGRFLITQDLDFSDMRQFIPGTHHGLLLVRVRVPGRLFLTRRLLWLFQNENISSWSRCFVLVTDTKIRVHSPK